MVERREGVYWAMYHKAHGLQRTVGILCMGYRPHSEALRIATRLADTVESVL